MIITFVFYRRVGPDIGKDDFRGLVVGSTNLLCPFFEQLLFSFVTLSKVFDEIFFLNIRLNFSL